MGSDVRTEVIETLPVLLVLFRIALIVWIMFSSSMKNAFWNFDEHYIKTVEWFE